MRTRPFAEPDARANGHSCTAGEDHGVFEELCFRFGIAFPLWPWLILIVSLKMKATSASPILQVSDLEKAISFYCDVLGFTKEFDFGTPPYYAGVKMNDVILHLNSSKENSLRRGAGSVYVFCDEVDAYFEAIRSRGAEITSSLSTWPYGMRDFQTKDIDGNLVCFGCPVADVKKG